MLKNKFISSVIGIIPAISQFNFDKSSSKKEQTVEITKYTIGEWGDGNWSKKSSDWSKPKKIFDWTKYASSWNEFTITYKSISLEGHNKYHFYIWGDDFLFDHTYISTNEINSPDSKNNPSFGGNRHRFNIFGIDQFAKCYIRVSHDEKNVYFEN